MNPIVVSCGAQRRNNLVLVFGFFLNHDDVYVETGWAVCCPIVKGNVENSKFTNLTVFLERKRRKKFNAYIKLYEFQLQCILVIKYASTSPYFSIMAVMGCV